MHEEILSVGSLYFNISGMHGGKLILQSEMPIYSLLDGRMDMGETEWYGD
jgi:hypothetical protein